MKKLLLLIAPIVLVPLPSISAQPRVSRTKPDVTTAASYLAQGRKLLDSIYKSRTGSVYGRYEPVSEVRDWLEFKYPAADVARLGEAIALLEKAERQAIADGGEALAVRNADRLRENLILQRDSVQFLGLALLERAQYVTQQPADFRLALHHFEASQRVLSSYDLTSFTPITSTPTTSWQTRGYLIAAELCARVGSGDLATAFVRFNIWKNSRTVNLQKEMAVPAMIEALDMVGDFSTAKGVLLRSAAEQMRRDGDLYMPSKQVNTRLAAKAYERHLDDALLLDTSKPMLPYERARRAGARCIRGFNAKHGFEREVGFIMAAPDLIEAQTKESAPLDTRLYAAQFKVSRIDEQKASANATVEAILNDDPSNVAALTLRGKVNYMYLRLPAAEAYLTKAIEIDPYLAYAYDAQALRKNVYQQGGQPELARLDSRQEARFNEILKYLREARANGEKE